MKLRPYQKRAVNNVMRAWHRGSRRICLVMPTGAGKTVCLEEIVHRARQADKRALFVVHRIELVKQAFEHLNRRHAGQVGIVGDVYKPELPIQVATVQTMLARNIRPEVDLVILDEAHHHVADEWEEVSKYYTEARMVGTTATPARSDDRPLTGAFDELIVGAHYSDLVRDGYLVDCDVWSINKHMTGRLATHPVVAYQDYGDSGQAFCFAQTVDQAYDFATEFSAAGIPASVIEAETPKDEREELLDLFKRGVIKVLCNVYCLTEGVDVPAAAVCILARGVGHCSPYLQMVGRVLRPSDGKHRATLIDLSGACVKFGRPTEDRQYSLKGQGVKRAAVGALRVCMQCGYTYEGGATCPNCGFALPPGVKKMPTIYDWQLKKVYAGSDTPIDAKENELGRLKELARKKGWSIGWVAKRYRELFGKTPPMAAFSDEDLRAEYEKFKAIARERGYKPAYAWARYKGQWNVPPRKEW